MTCFTCTPSVDVDGLGGAREGKEDAGESGRGGKEDGSERDRGRHHISEKPINCACLPENGTHPCLQLVAVALQGGCGCLECLPGSCVEEEQRQGDDDAEAHVQPLFVLRVCLEKRRAMLR